ncbi:MAG: YihY/virulence factor BrkB family protein [Burkholderiaceae bacterium]
MTLRELSRLLADSARAWSDDYAQSMGAALAYYALFSLSPLLLITLAAAGLIVPEQVENGVLAARLVGMMGPSGVQAVQAFLEAAREPAGSVIAMLSGGALLLFGAMSVFAELHSALDRIWRVPGQPQASGWWYLVRSRFGAFAMTLATGALLVAWLIVGASVAARGAAAGVSPLALHAAEIGFGFLLVSLLFATIYKVVPSARIAWRDVWIGAALTAALFSLGKFLVAEYIGRSGVSSAFGAAGSLAALLVWLYYSAQIFLLGAEFTWVYANACGSRRPPTAPQVNGRPA